MNKSEEQIKSQYKKRRLNQLLVNVPAIIAVVLMYYLESLGKDNFYGIPATSIYFAFLLVFVAVLIFSIINWRCPRCNKYLGKRFNPKFCSRCGTELR